jgi:DNA-binding XRE family transcriptional regulator
MRTKRRKQASKRMAVERPTPERVIEAVAAASSVASWMLFSPRRSPNLAMPRAAALYLLRQEAGLRAEDVARLTGRKRETVHRATQQVALAVGHDESIADLVRRAQRLLASPHLDGRAYDPQPWSRSVGPLLGLEASRIAAGLTKRELARRASITAETLTRIERLQRATRASTLRKLATALEMPPALLVYGH